MLNQVILIGVLRSKKEIPAKIPGLEIVVLIDGKKPLNVPLSVWGAEKVMAVEKMAIGTEITVLGNVSVYDGNYNGKEFTKVSIVGRDVLVAVGNESQQSDPPRQAAPAPEFVETDLPF